MTQESNKTPRSNSNIAATNADSDLQDVGSLWGDQEKKYIYTDFSDQDNPKVLNPEDLVEERKDAKVVNSRSVNLRGSEAVDFDDVPKFSLWNTLKTAVVGYLALSGGASDSKNLRSGSNSNKSGDLVNSDGFSLPSSNLLNSSALTNVQNVEQGRRLQVDRKTRSPSAQPTIAPTRIPTISPTFNPTVIPTLAPSRYPTQPTQSPTTQPTKQPSVEPTVQPSQKPSVNPTLQPTKEPSQQPTFKPSQSPTIKVSEQPSINPTLQPNINLTAESVKNSNFALPSFAIPVITVASFVGSTILGLIARKVVTNYYTSRRQGNVNYTGIDLGDTSFSHTSAAVSNVEVEKGSFDRLAAKFVANFTQAHHDMMLVFSTKVENTKGKTAEALGSFGEAVKDIPILSDISSTAAAVASQVSEENRRQRFENFSQIDRSLKVESYQKLAVVLATNYYQKNSAEILQSTAIIAENSADLYSQRAIEVLKSAAVAHDIAKLNTDCASNKISFDEKISKIANVVESELSKAKPSPSVRPSSSSAQKLNSANSVTKNSSSSGRI